jgi:TRAP transporter TAXI family solute receptor
MNMPRKLAAVAIAALVAVPGAMPAAGQVYSMGSNPQGSLFFQASAAIAKVAHEKLNMQIRVQPMAGSSTYIPLINTGEVDFGLTNVDDTINSVRGTGNFDGKPNPNLRVTAVMFPLPLGLLVAADSPIKSTKDVKGYRMPSGYPGQTTGRVLQDAILASAGLTLADVRTVPVVNLFQGTEQLGKGNVDAAVIGPPVSQIQQANVDLASRGGVRFVSLDDSPAALAAMRKHLPVRILKMDPAPVLVGVVAPTNFMAYSIYLSTSSKMSDEAVYKLVKTLNANAEELKKITPVLNRFNPKEMTEKVDVQWHPGAVKFYTEVGQWPPKG